MLEGIDVNQRIEFISSMDKTEPHTIFILRPLTGLERIRIKDLRNESDIVEYILTSIVEIKNISASPKDFLNILDIVSLSELLNKVNEINMITQEDKKKV